MICRAGHYEPVAREGLVFILVPIVPSVLSWWWGHPWISLFFLLAAAAIALFFRNPERAPPREPGIVVSPADGRVVAIVQDAASVHLENFPLIRISIFMSIFNVHVNRWPISGRVKKITYTPGGFLDAREPEASRSNEQSSIVLDGEEATIEVVQVAGKIARRIACWVSPGEEVWQGHRFGLIRFGSRLDVYLPKACSVAVGLGSKVKAGETIVARLPRNESEKTA